MALRKKKKHAGEVNMSSMTDIIFMLLIFFMLTSTLVTYMPFKLPESDQRTNANMLTIVNVHKSGKIEVNNVEVAFSALEQVLQASLKSNAEKGIPTVSIAAEFGSEVGQLTKVLAVTNRLKARTVIATAPRE